MLSKISSIDVMTISQIINLIEKNGFTGISDGGTLINEVVSSWGDVKILKQDKDNVKALEGAVF